MKKTTAYARKMARNPEKARYNGAEFFNTQQRCLQYIRIMS